MTNPTTETAEFTTFKTAYLEDKRYRYGLTASQLAISAESSLTNLIIDIKFKTQQNPA